MRVLSVRKHATVRRRWQVHLEQEARETRREGKRDGQRDEEEEPRKSAVERVARV